MKRLVLLTFLVLSVIFPGLSEEVYRVTAQKLNVRDQPASTAKLIGSLAKDDKIEVREFLNGFARFYFEGKDAFASGKFLEKVEEEPAAVAVVEEVVEEEPVEAVPEGNATVYLFLSNKFYLEKFPISINGEHLFDLEGEESVGKMTGTRYTPVFRKINVHGEGKMVISYDFIWAEKPFHGEIALDISDGGVYYVKLYFENFVNGIIKKRKGFEFKQLKVKEGIKELADEKYTRNDDVDVNL